LISATTPMWRQRSDEALELKFNVLLELSALTSSVEALAVVLTCRSMIVYDLWVYVGYNTIRPRTAIFLCIVRY